MEVLLGKSLTELQEVALSVGLPRFAGKQLAEWIYQKRAESFDEMTNISRQGRERLAAQYIIGRCAPVREAHSVDGTRKYLFAVSGETRDSREPRCSSNSRESIQYVEAVYIPEDDRATLCVSTQAGCKMGCRFCMTGTLGFHGNLTAADILNQVLYFGDLTNIVLMGEGEPMDNIDDVMRVLEVLTAPYGLGWSPHRITVSTVGFIPGMKRFLDECDCHLAISLHNPFPAERSAIMPAEKLYPIQDVLDLVRQYDWSHQRRISFEYICWGMQNTTQAYGRQLLKLLQGLECRINLIRFHEGVDRSFPASDEQQMVWLRDYLTRSGITTTIRRSRGEDILAACGMLVNALIDEKGKKN